MSSITTSMPLDMSGTVQCRWKRYGLTYFNAIPVIPDFLREHVLPPESNERRREKDELQSINNA